MNGTDPDDVVVRAFALGPGGHGFNPGRVLAVTLKITVNILAAHIELEEGLEWLIAV